MKYKYFCNDCGHEFCSDIPERDAVGFLNDISCPHCGSWDVYTNDGSGRKASCNTTLNHDILCTD